MNEEFQARSVALWASIDDHSEEEFRALIAAHVAELPEDHPVSLFERACAWDSTGHSDKAAPLYRRALDNGLDGENRRRAVIQMSSSIRNLGRPGESLALLRAEAEKGEDHLSDALTLTTALCLADLGREREALRDVITAMTAHLPRYQRSMRNYARLLVESDHE